MTNVTTSEMAENEIIRVVIEIKRIIKSKSLKRNTSLKLLY